MLKPIEYSHFDRVKNLILEAILTVYSDLSPENLSADGERSMSEIHNTKATLERQLSGLQAAYGEQVSVEQVYAWDRSRKEFEKTYEKTQEAFRMAYWSVED